MSGVASAKPRPSLDGLAELARLSVDGSTESIERILSLARAALDMDVAVMAAFDGDFVVQAVDGEHEWFDLDVGLRLPVNQTYCGAMTKGEIPHLVNDAAADDRTADLPLTREAGIGAYVGVPIRLWDGTLYGTLCCLSRSAEPSLNGRDVRFLRVLAEIVADQLDRDQLETEKRRLEWSRIHSILERDSVDVEFQPVFDLLDCSIVSLEALARFWTEPMRSPSVWFAEANEVGLGAELELAAIRSALQRIDDFPEGVALALNVSPATALDPRFCELLLGVAERIVIEITEHAQVDDYDALAAALAPLRQRGAQLAIDDVGAGFANLRHILRLAPDIVKLDLSLTQEISRDPARLALATSLVGFAGGVGARIVAEGISSDEDLTSLRALGVDYGQGFYLARPSALLN
ncbi:MAG TPA: EAL domain-containing protein [Gaiellaceae bacterium]|jgi:EAL domain-containing protein (putative c-di-GMP-specific phosphodiesterase class I)|nr:EAL domain-containing protein [Gaiellaceae bacterium]